MAEFEPAPITVSYNGILAAKILWNEAKLAKLSKIASLRRPVVITSENVFDRSATDQVGVDILAFKKNAWSDFGNNGNNKENNNPYMQVAWNQAHQKYYLTLHPLEISEYLRDKNKGYLDSKKFTSAINRLTVAGFHKILGHETPRRYVMFGPSVENFVVPALIYLLPFSTGAYFFSDAMRNLQHDDPFLRGLESLAALTLITIMALAIAHSTGTTNQTIVSQGNPYVRSLGEAINPVTPLLDRIKGHLYLLTKGRRIAQYKTS